MLSEAVALSPQWLVVVGHYPVYSRGEHGDISELKVYLLPLLQKYAVDVYLCGHDHIAKHLVSPDGMHVFVNGAGEN